MFSMPVLPSESHFELTFPISDARDNKAHPGQQLPLVPFDFRQHEAHQKQELKRRAIMPTMEYGRPAEVPRRSHKKCSIKTLEIIMKSLSVTARLLIPFVLLGFNPDVSAQNSADHASLVSLFEEFRDFSQNNYRGDIAGYPEAMQKRFRELEDFQQRLADVDSSDWPVSEQVDYHLVRAEMNGLEFQLRVLRPWFRNPAFYDGRAGGLGRLPRLPMDDDRLAGFRARLQAVPDYFKIAKTNLGGGVIADISGDLALFAIHALEGRNNGFPKFVTQLGEHHPDLVPDAKKAQAEIDGYLAWLKENRTKMTASGGVGTENYNWLLKNVYLFPYTLEEIRTIVKLEDNRVITFMKLEENRNRNVPAIVPVNSQEEYRASIKESLDHVMNFLREQEIFTVYDHLTIDSYWEERLRATSGPWPETHDYFQYFGHRETLMHETHEMVGHDFEVQRQGQDNRPIRGARAHEGPYFLSVARHEGLAFTYEELLMHAGYLDERSPHSREIVYEQAAYRTIRALADVHMHSGEWSLTEAMEYAVANAPRGDLLDDSPQLWNELRSTMLMVGWHGQMVMGKVQFMKLMRDRAQQLGDAFNLKEFMDEVYSLGTIPFSLVRWEMTGYDDEIKNLW